MNKYGVVLLDRISVGSGQEHVKRMKQVLAPGGAQTAPTDLPYFIGLGRDSLIMVPNCSTAQVVSRFGFAEGSKRLTLFRGYWEGGVQPRKDSGPFGMLLVLKFHFYFELLKDSTDKNDLLYRSLEKKYILKTIEDAGFTLGEDAFLLHSSGWPETLLFLYGSDYERITRCAQAIQTTEYIHEGEILAQIEQTFGGSIDKLTKTLFSRSLLIPLFNYEAICNEEYISQLSQPNPKTHIAGRVRLAATGLTKRELKGVLSKYSIGQLKLRRRYGPDGFVIKPQEISLVDYLKFCGELVMGEILTESQYPLSNFIDQWFTDTVGRVEPPQEAMGYKLNLDDCVLRLLQSRISVGKDIENLMEWFDGFSNKLNENMVLPNERDYGPYRDVISLWLKGITNHQLFALHLSIFSWIEWYINRLTDPGNQALDDVNRRELRKEILGCEENFTRYTRQVKALSYGLITIADDSAWRFSGGVQRIFQCIMGLSNGCWELFNNTTPLNMLTIIDAHDSFSIDITSRTLLVPKRLVAENFSIEDLVELPHEIGHLILEEPWRENKAHKTIFPLLTYFVSSLEEVGYGKIIEGRVIERIRTRLWVLGDTLDPKTEAIRLEIQKHLDEWRENANSFSKWISWWSDFLEMTKGASYLDRKLLGNAVWLNLVMGRKRFGQDFEMMAVTTRGLLEKLKELIRELGRKVMDAPEVEEQSKMTDNSIDGSILSLFGVEIPDNAPKVEEQLSLLCSIYTENLYAQGELKGLLPMKVFDIYKDFFADIIWFESLRTSNGGEREVMRFCDLLLGRSSIPPWGFSPIATGPDKDHPPEVRKILLRALSVFYYGMERQEEDLVCVFKDFVETYSKHLEQFFWVNKTLLDQVSELKQDFVGDVPKLEAYFRAILDAEWVQCSGFEQFLLSAIDGVGVYAQMYVKANKRMSENQDLQKVMGVLSESALGSIYFRRLEYRFRTESPALKDKLAALRNENFSWHQDDFKKLEDNWTGEEVVGYLQECIESGLDDRTQCEDAYKTIRKGEELMSDYAVRLLEESSRNPEADKR